jgi:hypothetical protein
MLYAGNWYNVSIGVEIWKNITEYSLKNYNPL